MRKLMSLALALVMSLALAAPAAAAEVGTSGNTGSVPVTITAAATTFSVTVPTSIPLNVDANAAVTCATNLSIQNGSAGPVEVTGISVQNNVWSIVGFNGGNRSSLASEKVNSNKLGLALKPSGGSQIATSTNGTQSLSVDSDEWVVSAGGSLSFQCSGIATAVSTSASNVEAAKVLFTLAWKEAGPSLISFTIAGTSYQAEEGMTWEEWVNSDYNTSDYYCSGKIYYNRTNDYMAFGGSVRIGYTEFDQEVIGSDTITNGMTYYYVTISSEPI